MNFKGEYKENFNCSACTTEQETTEHVIECNEYKKLTEHDTQGFKINEKEWLIKASETYKRIEETKELLNYNIN